ncbi:MAG: oxidoreductase [Verrucomicrobia bacterium]|nr:oxidoreductase [Verrucomicrobiota bacterium]
MLERTTFFVKERAGLLKLTDTYDIFDPASGQNIGIAKEEPPVWAKWLRLVVKKHMMPTAVNIYEQEGQPRILSIQRGFTFLRSKIKVVAGDGTSLGYFKSKLFSIGGGFYVFDNQNQQVAEVKGNWKGWDFKFLSKGGREIGTVTKKWAGLGKELFTSADNYIISLSDVSAAGPAASALLLAAGLAIDVVFKEVD